MEIPLHSIPSGFFIGYLPWLLTQSSLELLRVRYNSAPWVPYETAYVEFPIVANMNPPLDCIISPTKSSVNLQAGWMWPLFLGMLLWLFSPGLFLSHIPAFRDAYHFYYPQAVWLDHCAAQGNYFPVWNPVEGLGVSVAGQPSAALYYPLRVLWLIPGLNVAQRFSLFIVVHVMIANAGMLYAARKLELSKPASWLAAISFSLSCPVFFQHNNPIFLCSAAWIGFAAGALISSLCKPSFRFMDSLVFAIAGSMMLLAGDPHTAVNTFIVGVMVVGVAGCMSGKRDRNNVELSWKTWLSLGSLWFIGAGVMFTALTAVQWIPAWRHAEQSSRAILEERGREGTEREGRTRLGESSDDGMPAVNAILSASQPPRHRIYDFSLSPWHLTTTIWPTLGGDYLPHNSRVFAALPAEGRMWIPALYFGSLPCLLMLTALVRKKSRWNKTLFAVAAFSLLAALGSYTLVWLLRELLKGVGMNDWADQLPRDPVTGLYWLLCATIPAYDLFRYPAKWSVWLVAAGSLLAAQQFNFCQTTSLPPISKYLRRAIQLLSAIGLLASAVFGWFAFYSTGLNQWLAQAAPDAWLGPPRAGAVAGSLFVAFAVPLCVVSLKLSSKHYAVFTLAEMTLCASCWVSFVPPPALSGQFALPKVDNDPANTCAWADRSEADLLTDVSFAADADFAQTQAEYQQRFALGKLAALAGVRSLGATQSIEPTPLAQLRSWLSQHDRLTVDQPQLDQVLRELGVTHRLVRQREPNLPAKFQWQAIANPQPLCQLLSDNSGQQQQQLEATIQWQWIDSDTLEIHVDSSQLVRDRPNELLIRQFNDGGWIAREGTGIELTIAPSQLFLVVRLTGDETHLRLTRKWLW